MKTVIHYPTNDLEEKEMFNLDNTLQAVKVDINAQDGVSSRYIIDNSKDELAYAFQIYSDDKDILAIALDKLFQGAGIGYFAEGEFDIVDKVLGSYDSKLERKIDGFLTGRHIVRDD